MGRLPNLGRERFDPVEYPSEPVDGVGAPVRSTRVPALARHRDGVAEVAVRGDRRLHAARLPEDGGVRVDARLDHRDRPVAAVLLVGDEPENDLAARFGRVEERLRGDDRGRERALHVRRPAPDEPIPLPPEPVGVPVPGVRVGGDGVGVTGEQQRPVGGVAGAGDEVLPTGRDGLPIDGELDGRRPQALGQQVGDGRLLAGRVRRGLLDETPGQFHDGRLRDLRVRHPSTRTRRTQLNPVPADSIGRRHGRQRGAAGPRAGDPRQDRST